LDLHSYFAIFRFAQIVVMWLPVLMSIAWLIPFALLVKNIVYEKEQRLKEVSDMGTYCDTKYYLGHESDGSRQFSALDCVVYTVVHYIGSVCCLSSNHASLRFIGAT
jgi:hypothetical protein